jgi:hypothetical protein
MVRSRDMCKKEYTYVNLVQTVFKTESCTLHVGRQNMLTSILRNLFGVNRWLPQDQWSSSWDRRLNSSCLDAISNTSTFIYPQALNKLGLTHSQTYNILLAQSKHEILT